MKLNDKELELMIKHDVDEIVFLCNKKRVVIYDIKKLMNDYALKSHELRKNELFRALSVDD